MHDVNHELKVGDYALIGDCRSAALIGRNGSVGWLCWPEFDSPAILAGILDPKRGGHWSIAPGSQHRSTRRYLGETNVLETTFAAEGGAATLTDLMPVASEEHKRTVLVADHELVRQVKCTRGEIEIEMYFEPRIHYGEKAARIRSLGELGLCMEGSSGVYWLRSSVPLAVGETAACSRMHLHAGDIIQFSLSHAEESPAILPLLGDAARERIRISVEWWEQWAKKAQYDGPYRAAVVRSALVLKLLAYAPSGAIVAAPTTSLPERAGADLNWDYRFCWLRDASLTIRALTGLGYWDEAEAFMTWMLQATRLSQPELRILYTVFGLDAPEERELDYLCGHRESRPVRVGNAAREQLQLDVYGEVIDAAFQFALHGRKFDRTTQNLLVNLGKYVSENWNQPDEGLWEPRGPRQHHTHSRLLCWTALDRLCKLAAAGVVERVPVEAFAKQRELVRRDIVDCAWNQDLKSYASVLGGRELDASLLLLAWYGPEAANSERMRNTYHAICRELRAGPGLLYRYKTKPTEGAFGVCCFWEVEYLVLGGGILGQARQQFEHLLSYANDVGLFAEEIDPKSGDQVGNFPQAFTHVGLISAALSLMEHETGKQALGSERDLAPRPEEVEP